MAQLTPLQLAQLTALIDERERYLRADLHREAGQLADEHYSDIAGPGADRGEEAVADVAIDTENALMGRAIAELDQIEAARGRLKDGSYGKCVDCDADIVFGRLAAYPTVSRCAACQTRHEHGQAHGRPAKL